MLLKNNDCMGKLIISVHCAGLKVAKMWLTLHACIKYIIVCYRKVLVVSLVLLYIFRLSSMV